MNKKNSKTVKRLIYELKMKNKILNVTNLLDEEWDQYSFDDYCTEKRKYQKSLSEIGRAHV